MTALAIVALVAGGLALLRQLAGLALLVRFARGARLRALAPGPTPPISLLKPLYGRDEGLAANLVATLRQNYPEFEVLFVHERPDEPALADVAEATRAVPDVPVRTLAGRDAAAINPKVAVLLRGEAEARHDVIVAADSDVRPDPLWLRDIAAGLEDADAVSFIPILTGVRTPWARLAALAIDTDGLLAILVAGGRAMTGATIGVRRAALAKAGGFAAVADHIADDFGLGVALREAGCRLALARRPARMHMPGEGFRGTARLVVRWMRVIRSAAPGLFALMAPFVCTPLLLLASAALTPYPGPSLALLAALLLGRVATALIVEASFTRDGTLLRALPLLPLLWIAEPLALLFGLAGATVDWRGRRYKLKGGRASLVDA